MAELVAVGSRAFVVALAGIGAEPMRCETAEEFETALKRVSLDRTVRLVFVPEPMTQAAPEAVEAFHRRSVAALLALPLLPSAEHPSLEQMRFLIEQATGASLI